MVEVENLRNNWGEKKWNKFVEKSKKEFVKLLFVMEAFNSRLFKFLEIPDHMIFASVTLEMSRKGHGLNLVILSISQNVNQNSNKFASNVDSFVDGNVNRQVSQSYKHLSYFREMHCSRHFNNIPSK